MLDRHIKAAGGVLATLSLAMTATPAAAYMGAGAGLSAIGSILSFLGVILLMAVGFLWYPLKRLVLKLRNKEQSNDSIEQS